MSKNKIMGFMATAIMVVSVYFASTTLPGAQVDEASADIILRSPTIEMRVASLESKYDTLKSRYMLLSVLFCQTTHMNNIDLYGWGGFLSWNGATCVSQVTSGL